MQNNIKIFILNLLNLWILLSACPVLGQAGQMKHVKEIDYAKWGTLDLKNISDEGKWVSCEMNYDSRQDTLFLLSTSKTKTFAFPKGHNGHFAGERFFAFLEPESKLKVVQLKTQKIQVFEDVSQYELVYDSKYILTLTTEHSQKNTITIRNEKGKILYAITEVTEYAVNPDKDALLFSAGNERLNEIGILYFKDLHRVNISKSNYCKFHKLAWQKESLAVSFLIETDSMTNSSVLKYFRIKDNRLFSFDLQDQESTANSIINLREPLSISNDGKKVFFWVKKIEDVKSTAKSNEIEIWNGNDELLYPNKQHLEQNGGYLKMSVWFPETNFYAQINSIDHDIFGTTGKKDYVVIYNKMPYGLQDKYYEEADFYLQKLSDNKTIPILKKQSCDPQQMQFDPSSNRIAYYRENNWWIYDPDVQTHTNLTREVHSEWDNSTEHSVRNQFGAYGSAGWSTDGKNVLLYDEFDIWLAAADGSYCKRLTKGREKNIVFRISELTRNGKFFINFNMSDELVLEAKNTENWATGYYIFNFKIGEKPLVFYEKEIDQIHKSLNNIFVYKTQTYDISPRIEVKKQYTGISEIQFESNKQQKNYYFGKSELIYCTSKEGEKLKAALFYPANFNPSKKYPMVVHIYDSESDEIYKYVNPTQQNSEGFNITNYTLNGYFVLLPDITYKMGYPGISALECVTAAVDAAIKNGFIDKSKIGLCGHSFGGYEANFIITQTHIFAAAISGAGISDTAGFYFNVSKNGTFQSEMWRFENQQWRMGKSLYEDKDMYLQNSPILHAEKIKTPLLLWSGKEDRVVPYTQSISYYLAMRKLQIKSIMLVYPKEDHTLENPSNKEDLSRRMMDWFDYFLKEESASDWMSKSTSVNYKHP